MNFYTVKELEKMTKVTSFTWRTWIRAGMIPHVKMGRTVRVSEEDFNAFVSSSRVVGMK
jgi:excisionase family DNA binding protein